MVDNDEETGEIFAVAQLKRLAEQALYCYFFFFYDTATHEIYTLSLHDALPICLKDGTKYTGEYSEYALSVGCHYRLKDAIIPQILFEAGDFVIGVSYDINASSLSKVTKSQGGIEISLKYVNLSDATFKRRR